MVPPQDPVPQMTLHGTVPGHAMLVLRHVDVAEQSNVQVPPMHVAGLLQTASQAVWASTSLPASIGPSAT